MDTAISHDGVHGAGSIPGIRMSDKEPVFSTECGWAYFVFDWVIVDTDMPVLAIGDKGIPSFQGIMNTLG